VPFSSTQTAPGLFRLALVLLRLSVLLVLLVLSPVVSFLLFLPKDAEPVACRYAEAAARLLPVSLFHRLDSRLDWASFF
jgi:hypothetical protein